VTSFDSEPVQSTLYRHVVADARRAGLKVAEIGAITGVGERAVQNWANGTSKPDGASRDRLLELKYVIEQLTDVYEDEGIEIWLYARQRALDGERPVDLLRAGRFETVLQLIDRLAGGPRR
jgi:transcriptional regulator with XRE-family HTH domain